MWTCQGCRSNPDRPRNTVRLAMPKKDGVSGQRAPASSLASTWALPPPWLGACPTPAMAMQRVRLRSGCHDAHAVPPWHLHRCGSNGAGWPVTRRDAAPCQQHLMLQHASVPSLHTYHYLMHAVPRLRLLRQQVSRYGWRVGLAGGAVAMGARGSDIRQFAGKCLMLDCTEPRTVGSHFCSLVIPGHLTFSMSPAFQLLSKAASVGP
jgi:hypothetical protein